MIDDLKTPRNLILRDLKNSSPLTYNFYSLTLESWLDTDDDDVKGKGGNHDENNNKKNIL